MAGEINNKPLYGFIAIAVALLGGLISLSKFGSLPDHLAAAKIVREATQQNRIEPGAERKTAPISEKDSSLLTNRALELLKRFPAESTLRILNGKIWIGMTDSMLVEIKGEPGKVNRTVGSWGVHEQWIYWTPKIVKNVYSSGYRKALDDAYYYFEDGILTSWQESE